MDYLLWDRCLAKAISLKKYNNMKVDGKRSQSQIKNGDILLSYIGLLCQRMDEIGSSLREEILNANVAMFNTFHVQPSALESGLVPLDLHGKM